MKIGLIACAFAVAFAAIPVAYGACPAEFVGGAAPRATHAPFAVRTHDLCFDAFAVSESAATRTPLWSAEHLTAASVSEARTLPRHDDFHAEDALPPSDRAELVDYVHSGFDRGHMSPSGDMPSPEAQAQSFSLANIVPQNSALNRGLWEELEVATRNLAEEDGDIYVVTGPVFAGSPQALHDRVLVPQSVFKAIYDPSRNVAVAYVAVNTQPASYQVMSVAGLRNLIGIDVFPSLPEALKERVADLIEPTRTARDGQVTENAPPARRRHAIPGVTEVADRGPRFPIPN